MAYFGAAGTLGRPRMHAWMSRSTHGLRERLRTEPHGLVFSTPLAPGADITFRDERIAGGAQRGLTGVHHVMHLGAYSLMWSFLLKQAFMCQGLKCP